MFGRRLLTLQFHLPEQRPQLLFSAFVAFTYFFIAGCAASRNASAARSDESQRLAQQARQAEDRGDARTAELLLTAAVTRNPADCETRLELSELLLQQGSLDAAAAHLRKLVAQNPDDPRGYVRLAEALSLQGSHGEAATLVDAALEMDPLHTQGLLLRGRLHELAQRDDKALEAYHRVMLADPDQEDAELRIAGIYLKRGQQRQAAPLLRAVLESPHACPRQRSAAHWVLGMAYAQDERWADAAQSLAAGSGGRQMSADDWCQLAYARFRAGDAAGARQAVASALQVAPTDSTALAMQATLDGV